MSPWPRVVSVLMVVLMGFTALVVLFPNVQAATWTQDTDVDFNAGTFNGVQVVGTGSPAIVSLLQDATDWRNKTPLSNPGAREGPAMVYDSTNAVVVLFGGYDGANLADTWEYSPSTNTWTMITPPSAPTARAGAGMSFDSANGVVVLFGGLSDAGFEADTWEYNASANTWSQTTPAPSPPGMASYHLAFDSVASQSILFGLRTSPPSVMQTWAYDAGANSWTNRAPPSQPGNRAGQAMGYDATLNRVVLFGGSLFSTFDDTWEYDYDANTWTETTPTPSPSARTGAGMTYRATQTATYLFGGNSGGAPLGDTWRYFDPGIGRIWANVPTQRSPPARHTYGITDQTATGESFVFGGVISGGRASDTWAFGPAYRSSGNHESQTFDSFGANVNWNTLSFAPTTQPPSTTLRFQIAASSSVGGPWDNFLGPNCASNTYYTTSPTAICTDQDNMRYLRVRAYLLTTDNLNTPSLDQYTIDFTVPPVDPYIVLTTPADGTFGVAQTSNIFIRFSEPMDTPSVTYTINPNIAVSESWSEANSALTLDPDATLPECKAFTVTITGGNDTTGVPLNNMLNLVPNPFSFVTLCDNPEIFSTNPIQGAVDVPLTADLTITFSEPMDRATVSWMIDPDHMLSGSWSAGDTVLTLSHAEEFHQCTMHTVTIAGKDLAGLSLIPGPAPNPFDFTSECTIPYIVDTNPFNLESGVALDDPIFVNFSEPMDTSTVTRTIAPFLALIDSWSNGDKTLRLDHAPFSACTIYTVEITGAKDLDGNDLFPGQHETHAPNPWSFGTICPNPYLVLTIPMDGDSGVDQLADIMVQFSEPMNTASVDWNISPSIPLSGSWTGMDQILTLSHSGFPFLCGPNRVTITGNDVDGNPLVAGLAPNPWTFTPACPNPFIAVTSPANDDTGVSLGAVIDITFSEPMNTTSVTWIMLPDTDVTFSWTANDTELRLTPTAPLLPDTQYTVQITSGTDVDGNDLVTGPALNPWRFNTAGVNPYIVSTSPIDGDTGVSPVANVVITFSEPMETSTVDATPSPLIAFIESWSPDNMTLTLGHPAPFVDCFTYTITVTGEDPTGLPLGTGPAPNPFDFTIFCVRPSVTDTNPSDGAMGVPLNADIWVNFSEPMNTGSVSVALSPPAGMNSYAWSNGNRTVKVTHSSDFVECGLYTATVAGADVDGNPLTGGPAANPFSFRAACAAPVILSTVPIDGALGVDPAAPIVVTFSRAMDRATVTATFVPSASAGQGWTAGDTVLTLTPSPVLESCRVYNVTIAGRDTNNNSLVSGPVPNPFEFETSCPIGPPPNLRIAGVAPSTIRLTWNAVPAADRYRVYESANRFALFPSGWNVLDEPTSPSYNASGHLTDGLPHYYVVRTIRATTESGNSSMAAKIVRSFTFTAGTTNVYWFSLPYRSQYTRASDIANELGPGKIDVIAKWDRAGQRSIPYYWFRGSWHGTDFAINPGDGLWLGAVNAFSWAIFGTDPATTLSFTYHTPPLGNVNWVSVPFTSTYTRAADFVMQIEGNTGGGANTKITDVVRWNSATQSYERFYWTSGGWTGNNFVLAPGDAVYFQIVSSFTWTPSLVTPEVP